MAKLLPVGEGLYAQCNAVANNLYEGFLNLGHSPDELYNSIVKFLESNPNVLESNYYYYVYSALISPDPYFNQNAWKVNSYVASLIDDLINFSDVNSNDLKKLLEEIVEFLKLHAEYLSKIIINLKNVIIKIKESELDAQTLLDDITNISNQYFKYQQDVSENFKDYQNKLKNSFSNFFTYNYEKNLHIKLKEPYFFGGVMAGGPSKHSDYVQRFSHSFWSTYFIDLVEVEYLKKHEYELDSLEEEVNSSDKKLTRKISNDSINNEKLKESQFSDMVTVFGNEVDNNLENNFDSPGSFGKLHLSYWFTYFSLRKIVKWLHEPDKKFTDILNSDVNNNYNLKTKNEIQELSNEQSIEDKTKVFSTITSFIAFGSKKGFTEIIKPDNIIDNYKFTDELNTFDKYIYILKDLKYQTEKTLDKDIDKENKFYQEHGLFSLMKTKYEKLTNQNELEIKNSKNIRNFNQMPNIGNIFRDEELIKLIDEIYYEISDSSERQIWK